jgi:hypothetical protein
MAKDKKKKLKAEQVDASHQDAPKLKKGKKGRKARADRAAAPAGKQHPLEALSKLAEHPLVADLLAVGALAAVGAIAEAGKADPAAVKSPTAAKAAGKAAAAAIGARLLKEFTGGRAKKAGSSAGQGAG